MLRLGKAGSFWAEKATSVLIIDYSQFTINNSELPISPPMSPRFHSTRPFLFLLLLACLIAACSTAPTPTALLPTVPAATIPPTFDEITNLPVVKNAPTSTPIPQTSAPSDTATPTLTTTPIPTPLVFAVIGDYGFAGPDEEAVAALVQSWNPAFILTLGDNNYPNGGAETIDANIGQYFHSYIFPYLGSYGAGSEVNRFFPVPGNHDWLTADLQPYLDYFTLPGNERYYDFTWGPVHFYALDSDSHEPDGVGASSVQAQWFQQTLASSTATWQIPFMHHAPFSSSYHGSTDWAQWPYAEWGADVVLAGHDHVYERLEFDGIPYITNGLGGNPNRYWFYFIRPESLIRYQDAHGAMRVTATESTLTFEFITVTGELIDTLTLTQDAAGETPAREPTPQPGPPPNVTTFPNPVDFGWQTVASGYNSPVLLTHAHDGSNRLFVVEQSGVIRIIGEDAPFLDIQDRVGDGGNEQGLLGLAFDPKFDENGFFYVNYTDNGGDTIISRYQVSPTDPNQAIADSEIMLLKVNQPYENHNGGHLAFGPDGYLYIALGDGGSGGDPQGNGQNLNTHLGKILRIDVSASPYLIPGDNPFANSGALSTTGMPEIWAFGLRNPWRFSFDRQTGDMYIGDVGQGEWEEIDFLAAGTPGGGNFGWNIFEGTHPYEGSTPAGAALIGPVWEYSHATGTCSVTGGYVYRGAVLPEWNGIYLFGDYCSGQVWGLLRDSNGVWQNTLLFETGQFITSFGEDEAGELYLVARQGEIYRLIRR